MFLGHRHVAVLLLTFSYLSATATATPQENFEDDTDPYETYSRLLESIVYQNSLLEGSVHSEQVKDIVSTAEVYYQQAQAMVPNHVHPHALMGKLYANARHFQQALNAWDTAKQLLTSSPEDEDLRTLISSERKRTEFGLRTASLQAWEDAFVAEKENGVMNQKVKVSDAISLTDQRLLVFQPNVHPDALHERATYMVLMLNDNSEVDPMERAWEARRLFRKAQDVAFQAWVAARHHTAIPPPTGLAGIGECDPNDPGQYGIVRGGKAWANAAEKYDAVHSKDEEDDDTVETMAYAVSLRNVSVSGDDAVISGGEDSDCRVYVQHEYVNLARNVPIASIWEAEESKVNADPSFLPIYDYFHPTGIMNSPPEQPPVHYGTVVLVAGYASYNFYHFIAETLPSLLMLKPLVDKVIESDGSKYKRKNIVVFPGSPTATDADHGFMDKFLRLLAPNILNATDSVIRYRPGEVGHAFPRLTAEKLIAATWEQPPSAPPRGPVSRSAYYAFDDKKQDNGPSHCLTPPFLLRRLRATAWKAAGVKSKVSGGAPLVVVYCTRAGENSRRLAQEKDMLDRLDHLVGSIGEAKLIVYDGSNVASRNSSAADYYEDDGTAASLVKFFSSASVVVGVHGAALTNIAFCTPGTVVVEIGFENLPLASHYRHMSSALGLRHVDIFTTPNERSLGASFVSLPKGGIDDIERTVKNALSKKKSFVIIEGRRFEQGVGGDDDDAPDMRPGDEL